MMTAGKVINTLEAIMTNYELTDEEREAIRRAITFIDIQDKMSII